MRLLIECRNGVGIDNLLNVQCLAFISDLRYSIVSMSGMSVFFFFFIKGAELMMWFHLNYYTVEMSHKNYTIKLNDSKTNIVIVQAEYRFLFRHK